MSLGRRMGIVPVDPAQDGDVVLVEVQQEGDHALDVRLVGCEGENPYVASSKIAARSVEAPAMPLLTRNLSLTSQYRKIEAQVQGHRRRLGCSAVVFPFAETTRRRP